MQAYIECKVVMLPTKDIDAPLYGHSEAGYWINCLGAATKVNHGWSYQHLYLTPEQEIKGGDAWINIATGKLWEEATFSDLQAMTSSGTNGSICRRVVATTDKSLGLPLIPNKWIEDVYVINQGKIDKVRLSKAENGNLWYRNLANPEVIILPTPKTNKLEELLDERWPKLDSDKGLVRSWKQKFRKIFTDGYYAGVAEDSHREGHN